MENMITKFVLASIIFMIYMTIAVILPLKDITAQIPAEEFSINQTCSHSETDPTQNATSKTATNNLLIYNNASLGFRIHYPPDWKLIQDDCILENQGLIQSSSILNFMSTPASKESGLFGVTVGDFIFNESIDTFVDVYSKDFADIIKSKEVITFTGLPAAKFVLKEGDHDRLLLTTFANDRKYDITLPLMPWFSNSTIQSMLNSFQVTNLETNSTNQNDLLNELG